MRITSEPAGIAAAGSIAIALLAGVAVLLQANTSGPDVTGAASSDFRGVNWADPRDNFAGDPVVPSGLSSGDSYDEVYATSSTVIGGFRTELGANAVRLPLNPASVGTSWWDAYRGAIDAATAEGFMVILSYWESDTAKDGRVDDEAAWDAMWDTVVDAYGDDPLVYLEPMNEPFGYSLSEWVALTSAWLDRHGDVPRGRIVISGTGYNDDVTGVATAPELDAPRLSLHFYRFCNDYTTADAWTADMLGRIGEHGARTLIDEAGAPMTTGLNYGASDGDVSTSYLSALTRVARDHDMGIVYWPGLRTGDAYSLTVLEDDGSLTVTNESGLARLRWGWGADEVEPTSSAAPAPPGAPLVTAAGARCLDVPGFSTEPGTPLDIWDCNGGGNQSWDSTADGSIRVYGAMCLTATGDGSTDAPATIEACDGSAAQRWTMGADGAARSADGRCLGTGGRSDNGAAVVVARCTGADGPRWDHG